MDVLPSLPANDDLSRFLQSIDGILNHYYAFNGSASSAVSSSILAPNKPIVKALFPAVCLKFTPKEPSLCAICHRLITLCSYLDAIDNILGNTKTYYTEMRLKHYTTACTFSDFYDTFLIMFKNGFFGNLQNGNFYYVYIVLFVAFLRKFY